MNINLVNTLVSNGVLSDLYKAGFVTDKIFIYHEMYLWVHAQMKTRGITKNQAVQEAQGKFDRDERTIWRALNSFSHEDH